MTQEAKEWFNANGFVLNESKTESITFKIKAEESQNFKMLGVYLDSKLTWAKHIDYVCKKLSRVLYMLRHLKLIVPYNYSRVAYFAYFQSIMKYGLVIWGNSAHTTRVFKLQKKAVRILTNSANNINKYDIRSDFHLYNTRQQHIFNIPLCRLSKTLDSFEYMAFKVANRFPPELFLLVKSEFVTKINNWLFSNPFYTIKEL
ncbi:hypothetical protein C0J52_22941 [Blattella germanica]|nr:hypothetical protein C0J52_22941 [Blattella germanica]